MSSEQNSNGTKLYGWIVAVGVLCVVGIGLVLAFAPEQVPLLSVGIFGFGSFLIAQMFVAQKIGKVGDVIEKTAEATAATAEKIDATDGKVVKMGEQLDGRLEKLLKAVEEAAFAKGRIQEKEEAAAAVVVVETKLAPAPPATVVNVDEMNVEADAVSIDQKEKKSV